MSQHSPCLIQALYFLKDKHDLCLPQLRMWRSMFLSREGMEVALNKRRNTLSEMGREEAKKDEITGVAWRKLTTVYLLWPRHCSRHLAYIDSLITAEVFGSKRQNHNVNWLRQWDDYWLRCLSDKQDCVDRALVSFSCHVGRDHQLLPASPFCLSGEILPFSLAVLWNRWGRTLIGSEQVILPLLDNHWARGISCQKVAGSSHSIRY